MADSTSAAFQLGRNQPGLPGYVPPPTNAIRSLGLSNGDPLALSNLPPSGGASGITPNGSSDQFSSIIDLLKQYQSGANTTLNNAQGTQIQRGISTDPGLIGAAPGLQDASRNASMNALNPTIGGAKDIINMATKAVSDYTTARQQAKSDAQAVIHEAMSAGSEAVNALIQSQPDLLKQAGYDPGTLQGVATSLKRKEDLEASNKKYIDSVTNSKSPKNPTNPSDNSNTYGFDINNVPQVLRPYIGNSSSGVPYVDLSGVTPTIKDKYAQIAASNGIKTITNAKDVAAIQAVSAAKANLDSFQSFISESGGVLPKDFWGQPKQYANVKLNEYFDINPQLGTFNTWRAQVLPLMNALKGAGGGAGGGAARLFNTIADLLPISTDTLDVANKKIQAINTILDNGDKSILGQGGTKSSSSSTVQEGATHVYNGVTYKNVGGTWKPQ